MTHLRRALLVLATLAGLACLVSSAWIAGERTVTPAQLRLPPGSPNAIRTRIPADGVLLGEPRLMRILTEALEARGEKERLEIVAAGVRKIRSSPPQYGSEHHRRPPAEPVPLSKLLREWDAGRPIDTLSEAALWHQLLARLGVPSRVVVTDGGVWPAKRYFSALEVWWSNQLAWVTVDPVAALMFSRPVFHPSVLEARVLLARGIGFTPTALATPLTPSTAEPHHVKYARRMSNVRVMLEPGAWVVLDDPMAQGTARTVSRWSERPVWVFSLLYVAVLAAGGGQRKKALRRDILALHRALTRLEARGQTWFWNRFVGPVHERSLSTVQAAYRAVCTVFDELSARWMALAGRPSGTVPAPRWVFLAGAGLGVALLLCQLTVLVEGCEEDAYIGFRFARNWAEGNGLTFNPGEKPVEGFSNTLWLLMLGAGYRLHAEMTDVVFVWSLALGTAHILLLAWMGRQAGWCAWLPLAAVATNVCVVHTLVSGMETALVTLLTTLVAWCWLTERADRPSSRLWTALACMLLSLARTDGAFLFAVMSVFRLLEAWRRPDGRLVSTWFAPFLVPELAHAIWRQAHFGTVIPYIYQSRLLLHRGELLDRVPLGIDYLAHGFCFNGVWMLGLVGIVAAWRCPSATKLAVVALAQVVLIVLVGGDAPYMQLNRFLVPISGCLGLLAQHAIQTAFGARRAAGIALGLGLVWVFNGIQVPRTVDAAGVPNRLLRPPPDLRATALDNVELALSGACDVSRQSLDGRTGRHLAAWVEPGASLACTQAGQIAFFWPGTFKDAVGLVLPPPRPWPFNPSPAERPLYYLLFPFELEDNWRHLRDCGYRLQHIYMGCQSDNSDPIYTLLKRSSSEGVPLTSKLFDGHGKLAWWRAGPRHYVIFSYTHPPPRPLFDGPRHSLDSEQLGQLHWIQRNWLLTTLRWKGEAAE